jgi:hypothetical protein
MDKLLINQRYIPIKRSTTSDCQVVDYGSGTAEPDNLAAIIKNNTILFDQFIAALEISGADPGKKVQDNFKD